MGTGKADVGDVGSCADTTPKFEPALAKRMAEQQRKEVTGESAIMTETPSPCKARLRIVDAALAKRMDEQRAKTEEPMKPEQQPEAGNLAAEISDNYSMSPVL